MSLPYENPFCDLSPLALAMASPSKYLVNRNLATVVREEYPESKWFFDYVDSLIGAYLIHPGWVDFETQFTHIQFIGSLALKGTVTTSMDELVQVMEDYYAQMNSFSNN